MPHGNVVAPSHLCRTVEYCTNATLSHLPPLHHTQYWQHALATAQEKRLARLQQAEGDISWLKTARAFRSVFAGSQSSRRGDQLVGVQEERTVRYIGGLAGDQSKSREFRFALFPHFSGFDAAAQVPAEWSREASVVESSHQEHEPQSYEA